MTKRWFRLGLVWMALIISVFFLAWPAMRANKQSLYILSQAVRTPGISPIMELPSQPDAVRLYGRVLMLDQDYPNALPVLETSTAGRSAILAYADLCYIHWLDSDWQSARDSCLKGEVHPLTWTDAGQVYWGLGDRELALRAYTMSLLIDPDFLAARNLIIYARDVLEPSVRVEIFEPVIGLYPDHSAYLNFVLGEAYYQQEEYEQARVLFLAAEDIESGIEQVLYYLDKLDEHFPD